ncbi:MAG: hypothetical protein QOE05_3080 [Actinomycetota bacterium]|jgi:drug/metabolite transporter (DMT)-like permease|nr:hypothetical protein [Actinomycetota bacterium]
MKHSWVPYAAIAGGASLLVMTVLVFATEDKVSEATAVPFYFAGLLLAIAAAIGAGLRARPGRRALTAVPLALLVVAWVMILGEIMTPVFEALFGDQDYVGDQGPIGLLGLVLIALGARAKLTEREPALA